MADALAMAAVVSTQPSAGMQAFMSNTERDWNSSVCGCCTDCKSSLCVCFCPCIFQGLLAKRMRESCCVPFLVPAGLLVMRTRMRSKLDIKGSICRDCWGVMLCGPLIACQMSRELDHVGVPIIPLGGHR